MTKHFKRFSVCISLASFIGSTAFGQVQPGAAANTAAAIQQNAISQAEKNALTMLPEPVAAPAATTPTTTNTLTTGSDVVTAPVAQPVYSAPQPATTTYVPPATTTRGSAVADTKKSSALQTVAMVGAIGVAAWTGYLCANPHMSGPVSYPTSCYFAMAATAAAGFLLASKSDTKKAADQMATAPYQPGEPGYDPNCPLCPKPAGVNGNRNPNDPTGVAGNGYEPGSTEAKVASEYQDMKKKMEGLGFTLSADGQSVTGPDGKTQSLKYVTSPEGMAAAGMSADQISAVQAAIAAEAKKASDSVKGVAMVAGSGGGGGNGGGELGGSGTGSYGGEDPAAMAKRLRDANIPSGMALGSGDSTRGIASDNMFKMINIRYQAYDSAKAFDP